MKNICSLDLTMPTEKDDFISACKLFRTNTILLKYEFRKREILHRFGRLSPELERVEKTLGNILIDVKFVHPRFTFVEEYDVFNFMQV